MVTQGSSVFYYLLLLFLAGMHLLCQVLNVSKSYGPQETLFSDLNFQLSRGELLGITGSNGSGKTTLIRMLAGAILPETGTILHKGVSTAVKPSPLNVGYQTSEDGGFFDRLTGLENLRFFATHYRVPRKLWSQCKEDWSQGSSFQRALETKFFHCSSGMKRMLSLFRALTFCPDLVILDEPLRGLDQKAMDFILNYFNLHQKEFGAIVAFHNLSPFHGLIDHKICIEKS